MQFTWWWGECQTPHHAPTDRWRDGNRECESVSIFRMNFNSDQGTIPPFEIIALSESMLINIIAPAAEINLHAPAIIIAGFPAVDALWTRLLLTDRPDSLLYLASCNYWGLLSPYGRWWWWWWSRGGGRGVPGDFIWPCCVRLNFSHMQSSFI